MARMKPGQVRFHHIRDWPWRQIWCQKHGWVPYFHEHHGLCEFPANPRVTPQPPLGAGG